MAFEFEDIKTRKLTGWEGWNTIGLALYRATAGSDEGFEVFDRWSARNPKYNAKYTHYTWYVRFRRCPPTRIGAGTLFAIAEIEQPGWQKMHAEEQQRQRREKEDELLASLARRYRT